MKKILFVVAILLTGIAQSNLYAQYPYWDDSPGMSTADPLTDYAGPLAVSANGLFGFHNIPSNNGSGFYTTSFARWTECGGWEDLPGLTVEPGSMYFSLYLPTKMLTVHDHYLYAVGFFSLAGYTNAVNSSDLSQTAALSWSNYVQIARFDFNTGLWQPLGQNFTATNVVCPTTVTVDDNGWIYVGFALRFDPSCFNEGQSVNMLNVSTNNGASWQTVGNGLAAGDDYEPMISALCAVGTNVYIGGDFYQAVGGSIPSPHIIMWNGNSWVPFINGVAVNTSYTSYQYDSWRCNDDVYNIQDIACIGTNVFVTGNFDYPQIGIARFSNINGASLPIDDSPFTEGFSGYLPAGYVDCCGDLSYWGSSLAANNGNLYLGMEPGAWPNNNGLDSIACLTNPADSSPNPSDWSSLDGGTWPNSILYLAATTNGNAVYTSEPGFARWMLGPDGAVPSVNLWLSNVYTVSGSLTYVLHLQGTSGSHWQIMSSVDDTNWNVVANVTLWGCGNTANLYITNTPGTQGTIYYMAQNNCSSSQVVSSTPDIIDVQFGGPGVSQQTGAAVIGYSSSDYWNMVPGEMNFDPTWGFPLYLDTNQTVVTSAQLLDVNSNSSGITLNLCASTPNSGDPPVSIEYGTDPMPFLNSYVVTAGSPFNITLTLPGGHYYDIYMYSATGSPVLFSPPDVSTGYPTISGVNSPADVFVEGDQYTVWTDIGAEETNVVTIQVSSDYGTVCNGLQIMER